MNRLPNPSAQMLTAENEAIAAPRTKFALHQVAGCLSASVIFRPRISRRPGLTYFAAAT